MAPNPFNKKSEPNFNLTAAARLALAGCCGSGGCDGAVSCHYKDPQ